MYISKVYIFKTPLDKEYRSVVDYTSKNMINSQPIYKQCMMFFDYKLCYERIAPSVRSINLNKNISITIEYDNIEVDFDNIREYNWLVFVSYPDEKPYYYFIEDYTIHNNLTEITFNLKWDAWTNNLKTMLESNTVNHIERRHIDDFTTPNSNNISYGRNYISDEEECPVNKYCEPDIGDPKYVILYKRYWLNGEHITLTGENGGSYNFPLLSSLNPIVVFMRPYCVIDKKTREIAPFQYYRFSDDEPNDWQNTIGRPFDYFEPYEAETSGNFSTAILYCDLTTHPQIQFNIDTSQQIVGGIPTYGMRIGGWGQVHFDDVIVAHGFVASFEDMLFTKEYEEFQEDLRYKVATTYMNTVYKSKNFGLMAMYEPRLHQYPYEYTSYKFGQNVVDLIPHRDSEFATLKMYVGNRVSPQLHVKIGDEIRPYGYYKASNFGSLPTVTDSLSQYLLQNASQNATNMIFNRINLAIGALHTVQGATEKSPDKMMSGVKSMLSSIHNTMNLSSRIKDEDSKQDQYNIPSTFAMDDLNYQDDLARIRSLIIDDTYKTRLLKRFNLYGINFDNFGNVFENTRNNFDYVLTSNCLLPIIKDAEDRAEIENAFNNGIRKWHLDTCYIEATKSFDTDYVNIQKSLFYGNILGG